jgi:hypothetical protein
MLNKLLNFSLLAMIVLLCTACPYESDVPVDVAKIAINESVLGRWKENTAENKDYCEITKLNATQYTITNYTKDEAKEAYKTKEYIAHLSKVDGMDFINLSNPKKPSIFMIYKIVLSADGKTMTLFPLSEHIREKFTTSKELQEFISKHKNLSFFYGQETLYVR